MGGEAAYREVLEVEAAKHNFSKETDRHLFIERRLAFAKQNPAAVLDYALLNLDAFDPTTDMIVFSSSSTADTGPVHLNLNDIGDVCVNSNLETTEQTNFVSIEARDKQRIFLNSGVNAAVLEPNIHLLYLDSRNVGIVENVYTVIFWKNSVLYLSGEEPCTISGYNDDHIILREKEVTDILYNDITENNLYMVSSAAHKAAIEALDQDRFADLAGPLDFSDSGLVVFKNSEKSFAVVRAKNSKGELAYALYEWIPKSTAEPNKLAPRLMGANRDLGILGSSYQLELS
jgi:hypothetical protein